MQYRMLATAGLFVSIALPAMAQSPGPSHYHASKPMIGGVIATAGDVVFTGELNGNFEAFDAKSGNVLYTHSVGGPIAGGLVSYASGGKQYVAVVSGYVGISNMAAPDLGRTKPTITFAHK